MEILLWSCALLLVLLGLTGTVLPAVPGTPLVFGGLLLGAWLDQFQRVGTASLVIIGILAVIAWLADWFAATLGARRAGASPLAVAGAAIGTVVGVFAGVVGLLFAPLVGAGIGEWLARNDLPQAARVGLATWIGLLVATAIKVALTFAMIGVFAIAWMT